MLTIILLLAPYATSALPYLRGPAIVIAIAAVASSLALAGIAALGAWIEERGGIGEIDR